MKVAPQEAKREGIPALSVVMVPVGDLHRNPANYRHHPPAQVAQLQYSVRDFGQYKPIIAASDGTILAGHGVFDAARAEGAETVAVVYMPFAADDPRAAKLMVADNETVRGSEDDSQQLAALLADLQATVGLEGTGHDAASLDALIADLAASAPKPPVEDPGPPEPLPEAVTRLGDVWCMGEHRLVAGDCTDGGVVEAVTQGRRFSAILTDPPYQMGKDIAGDSLGDVDFADLHRRFVAALPAADACTFACFHSPRTFPVVLDAAREAGWYFERMLWMYKPNDCTFPWRGWLLTSEASLLFSRGGGVWADVHPFAHDTYDHLHGAAQKEDRGGQRACKPLPVVSDILSRIGDGEVFDPFLGSGTTLIAAEQLGRVCYGIEIEPRYADVCCRRFHNMTGKPVILESTGEEFPFDV